MFPLLCQSVELQLQSLVGSADWLIVMCFLAGAAPELSLHSHSLVPASCSNECDPFKRLVLLLPVLLFDKKKMSCPNFPSTFTQDTKDTSRHWQEKQGNIPIINPTLVVVCFHAISLGQHLARGLCYEMCKCRLALHFESLPIILHSQCKDILDSGGGTSLSSLPHGCPALTVLGFPATFLVVQPSLLWSSAVSITTKRTSNRSILLCCHPLAVDVALPHRDNGG